MKVVKTVKEAFDDLVETLPGNTVMVDYTRAKKNHGGDFSSEDEVDNEETYRNSREEILEKIGRSIELELDNMKAGEEYDIITIVMPRQSVELLSFDEINE